MNITSYLANKCLQFLIDTSYDEKNHTEVDPNITRSSSIHKTKITLLPPWAKDTDHFKRSCNGCSACVTACENDILAKSDDGYPFVDFSIGGCSFCGECAKSCPEDALEYNPSSPPWALRVTITSECLAHKNILCRTCLEHCDEEAITISRSSDQLEVPAIQTDNCTGCGSCVYACPVKAIEISEKYFNETNTDKEVDQ